MSQDFEATVAAMQSRLNAKELTRLAREREQQAERADHICAEVLNRLGELTTGLDFDQLRDVLDTLAGRIEARLERMDDEELADGCEEEEEL